MCCAEGKLQPKSSKHTFSSDMSHPRYKKIQVSYKQFNTYTTATSYVYSAQVLPKHAHAILNEKLLLSLCSSDRAS